MLLAAVRQRVGEPARARVLRWLQRHERQPEHERACVPVVELAYDYVPGALGGSGQTAPTVGELPEPLLQRRPPADRCVPVRAERALCAVVFTHHPPKRLRIAARELGELCACAIEVSPLSQPGAVGKGDVNDGIGLQVLEPVLAKLQLIVAQRRARLDQIVRRRASVVQEAGQRQFLRRRVTTHDRPRVEHATLEAGVCQVRRGDERIVSASGDDDVKRLAHPLACARWRGSHTSIPRRSLIRSSSITSSRRAGSARRVPRRSRSARTSPPSPRRSRVRGRRSSAAAPSSTRSKNSAASTCRRRSTATTEDRSDLSGPESKASRSRTTAISSTSTDPTATASGRKLHCSTPACSSGTPKAPTTSSGNASASISTTMRSSSSANSSN